MLRDENLLVFALFIALLLTGAVQYYDIFALAFLGVCVSVLLLARANWVVSKEFRWIFFPLLAYLSYILFLDFSASGLTYIAFRSYDIIFALVLINFAIQREIDFICAFLKVTKVFAVHALINWVIVIIFFDFFSTTADIKSYQLFYIFFGMSEQPFGIYRSQGFFWEPGVLQVVLNMGLLLSLFVYKSRRWALFFLFNVILTQSTTGITVSAALLVLKFFGGDTRMSLYRFVNAAFFLMLLSFFVFFALVAVEQKFFGEGMGSMLARSYDLQVGASVIRDYPLGIGFNPQNYLYFAENNVYGIDLGLEGNRDQTNGWLILFISSGIFWGLIIGLRLVYQQMLPENRLAVFAVLLPSLATEPIFFSPFVMFFILYSRRRIQAFR